MCLRDFAIKTIIKTNVDFNFFHVDDYCCCCPNLTESNMILTKIFCFLLIKLLFLSFHIRLKGKIMASCLNRYIVFSFRGDIKRLFHASAFIFLVGFHLFPIYVCTAAGVHLEMKCLPFSYFSRTSETGISLSGLFWFTLPLL